MHAHYSFKLARAQFSSLTVSGWGNARAWHLQKEGRVPMAAQLFASRFTKNPESLRAASRIAQEAGPLHCTLSLVGPGLRTLVEHPHYIVNLGFQLLDSGLTAPRGTLQTFCCGSAA